MRATHNRPHKGPPNTPGTHCLVLTGLPIAAVACSTCHSQYARPTHEMLFPCQLYPQTTGIYKLRKRRCWPTQQHIWPPTITGCSPPHPHPMPKAPTNQSPNSPNPPQRRRGLRETCQHSCRSNSQQHQHQHMDAHRGCTHTTPHIHTQPPIYTHNPKFTRHTTRRAQLIRRFSGLCM